MTEIFNTISRSIKIAATVGIVMGILTIVYLEANLPSVDVLKDVQLQVPLKIFSADGKLIAEYGEKRRTPIKLTEVPPALVHAILSTEDSRFYQHPGVDLKGLMRAVVTLVTQGKKQQGGSTITMQVARNFFLTRKKTYTRKINEILLALKIEQELSKDEILELYLNKIYFGKRAYGVQAAAEVYYGKGVSELRLAQIATIAGLPQAPSAINPLNNPAASLKRRHHVLERMLAFGHITQAEFDQADKAPVTAEFHGRSIELHAPHVAEMVRQQLIGQYGENVYDQGIEVYTTIDSKLQEAGNQAMVRAVLEYDQRHGWRKPRQTFALQPNTAPQEDIQNWLKQLATYPNVSNLQPAVVSAIEDNKIWVLLKNHHFVEIPWKYIEWAKPQLKRGFVGKKPSRAQEVVQVGHLVYVKQVKGNTYQLAQKPEVEGALVAIQPTTGAIKTLCGGFDYLNSGFNRVIQAERQPGSSFKPFIYAAALENGFTTASIINDAPIVQEDPMGEYDWRPQNHTRKFYGPTRLREGITKSRNLVSIRLLKSVGVDEAIQFISKFGFRVESMPKGLSLALGTASITPLELTTGFSVFANGGHQVTPYLIAKVIDYQDNILFEANPPPICEEDCDDDFAHHAPRVLSTQQAYLMTSMLQDAIRTGTGRRALSLKRRDLAGKTGTTNDQIDAWYAGFNSDLAVTCWMGFDEPRTLREYGGQAALPMWMYYIEQALKDQPEHSLQQPPGLVTVRIDPRTGLLARDGQPDAIYEIFTEDTVPTQVAPTIASVEEPTEMDSLF